MRWKKIIRYLHNPCKIVNFLGARGGLKFIPDKLYLKLRYYAYFEKKLNLENPTTFNEKNQWLKLYDRNPIYTQMVDKSDVRQYLAAIIGEEYLIPLIGVWDKFDDIDFSQLPDKFVLKCTHDSGGVVVVKDKDNLDIESVRKIIKRSLKRNFYYYSREWPYKDVKPRIICEKYLVDESGYELKDYKVACFNGKAKFFYVCLNRTPKSCNIDMYDMNWNPMPFYQVLHPNSGTFVSKPRNFDKMVEIAEKLAKNLPYLRVDFYEPNGELFMGELTFFHGSGFEPYIPESYDYLMGSWLKLPSVSNLGEK